MKPRIVVALLASIALTAVAHSQEAPRTQTPEEAIRADARYIANSFGVSLDEAVRRFELERDTADDIAALRETYRDRMAGIFIEHRPDYHVVLRLKGAAAVAPVTLGSGDRTVRVEVVTGAPATLQELQSAITSNLTALAALLPGMLGIAADERTGEIAIDVQANAVQAPAVQAQLGAVRQLLGHPVRLRTLDATHTTQAVRAGSNLQYACTSGFVVQTGTSKGPMTAAHCPSTLDYYDLHDGTNYTLTGPPTAMKHDASHDVRWLNATTNSPVAQFYADTATPRVVTGKRSQSATTVGSTVCHQGIGTGYSCGSVESTAYTPTKPVSPTNPNPYYCGPSGNITCASTWVQIGGSSLRCAGGDSGGPWFAGTLALGVHTGGTVSQTGYCVSAWYMSTDRISTGLGSGYTLLIGT